MTKQEGAAAVVADYNDCLQTMLFRILGPATKTADAE